MKPPIRLTYPITSSVFTVVARDNGVEILMRKNLGKTTNENPKQHKSADTGKHQYDHSAFEIYAEAELLKDSRLSELENSGVLPMIINPNPHDPVMEPDQHDQWWREHQNEANIFSTAIEAREAAIKHIYIGLQMRA